PNTFLGSLLNEIEQLVCLHRVAGKPVIKWILDRLFDDALSFGGSETLLRLALEFRFAVEYRRHAGGGGRHSLPRDGTGAGFRSDGRGVILEPAEQGGAQTGLMRAAIRSRYGVAVRVEEPVGVDGPGHRPFDRPVSAGLASRTGEDVRMHQCCAGK